MSEKFEIENPHPPPDPSVAGGEVPQPPSYRVRRMWFSEQKIANSLKSSEKGLRGKWRKTKLPRPPG